MFLEHLRNVIRRRIKREIISNRMEMLFHVWKRQARLNTLPTRFIRCVERLINYLFFFFNYRDYAEFKAYSRAEIIIP